MESICGEEACELGLELRNRPALRLRCWDCREGVRSVVVRGWGWLGAAEAWSLCCAPESHSPVGSGCQQRPKQD